MSIVAAALACAFVAVLAQLCRIQYLQHDKYKDLARRQHFTKVEIPVRRGTITDCRGIPLAISLPVQSLYADPKNVKQKSMAAWKLAPVLGMEPQDIFARLIRNRRFIWIKRRLTDEEYKKVRGLELKGIGFRPEYRRIYPQRMLLGQALGFCGIDDNGLDGLELQLEEYLLGKPGYRTTRRDAAGNKIAASRLKRKPAANGLDVVLTVDANIQRIAEEELDKACEQWRPVSGVAIVMEPATGDILALVNWPFFDPGAFRGLSAAELRTRSHNTAALDVYEPGSTFKPFAVSAALEEKVVTPDTVFDCGNGSAILNGRRMRDAHRLGELTVSEIVIFSSNIGVGRIALRLGKEKLYEYVRAFGFGRVTGLPVACEPAGLLAPPRKWSRYTITSIPMGQEIAVTPVQLTAAYSALAMSGKLMKPRLLKAIVNPDTNRIVKKFPARQAGQVVSPQTARDITEMLVQVIENERGTGRKARIDNYILAGKTGTAQKSLPNGRGYSPTDYVSSFVAFAPAYRPRVCVLVKIDTPRGCNYGGTVAAPAVREIIRRTLAYLDVPPGTKSLASIDPG